MSCLVVESNANSCEDQVDTNNVLSLESQSVSKRRRVLWKHFFCLDSTQTKDGKERTLLILDPRFKFSFLKYCYEILFEDETEAVMKAHLIKGKLAKLFKEYDPETHAQHETSLESSSNSNTESLSGNKKHKFDLFADYDKEETMILDYTKTHLDVYYKDPKMDRKTELDILNFWKDNEQRYGRLSYLARDILSVPLTIVASESTFSIGG
ncbi:hypothetical protein GQ457_17G014410 [Hibiscus cannabinus]